jgi:hypothetical protein
LEKWQNRVKLLEIIWIIYKMLAKKILIERYYHADSRSRGNEIVRQFIIDRQLIVTGGLVIDFALKRNGHKGIYESYEVPDYDFFSPDNATDASDLFKILMKAGFENISLLPGIHPSTVKIFVFKDCIADITYMDKRLFKEMGKSAFIYDEMKVRNPYYQFADMHRALSFPYENEPRETINNRWKKDFERFVLLYPNRSSTISDDNMDTTAGTLVTSQSLEYPIAGRSAINFYLNKSETPDAVYLMTPSDYKSFLSSNGKHIRDMEMYKSYQELMPERTEMLFRDKPLTILHCRNKTSIYYPDEQKVKQKEFIRKAKSYLNIASTRQKETYAKCVVSLNFCITYAFSMFQITDDKWYDEAYRELLALAYVAYRDCVTDLFPSIITYGDEMPNPIIEYTTEHPEARVPQVHIKSEDNEDVVATQVAKLPYDFSYDPSVYLLDGKIKDK